MYKAMYAGYNMQKWMNVVGWTIGSILIVSLVFSVSAEAQEDKANRTAGELYALSAVLMDADNGRILLQKNGNQILPMASTTKIMTCILALETASMDDYVSASAYAAGMPKVHLGVRKGEVFQIRDLMYSLMLESHNDAAVIIAEHVGNILGNTGKRSADNTPEESKISVLKFTQLMNAKAEEIGCENTFFVTPNGLDGTLTFTDSNGNVTEHQHTTTAEDLARIMAYCICDSEKKEEFLEITQTREYQFTDYVLDEQSDWKAGGKQYSCYNHNAFLDMMDGVLTGKTGFTGKAGYCYVGALRQGGRTYTIALLACGWPNNKSWKWHDARILYGYGLENYEKKEISVPVEMKPVRVTDGVREQTRLECKTEEVSLLLSDSDEVYSKTEFPEFLEAPVVGGRTVGWQSYYVNGELYARFPIRTIENVERISYLYCLKQILKEFAVTKR